MRFLYLVVLLSFTLLAMPFQASAKGGADYGGEFDDSRRPDLGIARENYGVERPVDVDVPDKPEPRGNSTWEEYYVSDIDTTEFMGRLYEVLTREEWLGQFDEVAAIAGYMKEAGLFNLGHMHQEMIVTDDYIYSVFSEEYNDLDPESYYAKLMSLEDAELVSAGHVTDDFLLYFGVNNLTDIMLLQFEQMMATAEMAEEMGGEMDGMEEMAQAWGMIEAFQIDQIVKNVLTGEIAMVLYDMPELEQMVMGEIEPSDIDMAAMIGISDGDYVLSMIEQYGQEIGLMGRQYEGDDWHYYVMQGQESLGLMFSDELLLVTTNLDVARDHVIAALKDGGIEVDPCQFYLNLNINEINDTLIVPGAELAMMHMGTDIELPVEPLGYLFNISEETDLGSVEMTTHNFGDGCSFEFEMKKSVVQYMVFGLGLVACGAAQSGAFN